MKVSVASSKYLSVKTELTKNMNGGDRLHDHNCRNCREGLLMGDKVYCSVYGKFHPPNYVCKNHIAKIRIVNSEEAQ